MSPISGPVQQVLQARNESAAQQVDVALMKKQLDVRKQSGDAINALLEQAVKVQSQLANGQLDVKA